MPAALLVATAVDEACEAAERRIALLGAEHDLALEEAFVVVPGSEADGVVGWRVRLDHDSPRAFAATSAAGHLGQKLKTTLGCPEIGQIGPTSARTTPTRVTRGKSRALVTS